MPIERIAPVPIISVTGENLDDEHICCGFSDKKCAGGYAAKKQLMRARFAQGYTFKKLDVRGKVFVEYVPAEYAWAPVVAPNYMFIHCFWVSGRFKGQGHGRALLNECITDSAGKDGIVVVSSQKPKPFLTDKRFFLKHGFEIVDSAPPYFELLALRTNPNAPLPRIAQAMKDPTPAAASGLVIYYSALCPFTEYYVDEVMQTARDQGLEALKIKVESHEQAQATPAATPIFTAYLDGEFLTHEVLNKGRFVKLVDGPAE